MTRFKPSGPLLGGLVCPLLALALAGCSAPASPPSSPGTGTGTGTGASSDAEAQGELSEESLVMAETAWLSVSEDGEVFKTFLDPDGRYRDVRDGALAFTGTWEQNAQDQLCFSPDQGTASCWSHGSPGLDDMMRATDENGRAIELRRIAYVAPPAEAENAEEAGTQDAETEGGQASDNAGQSAGRG